MLQRLVLASTNQGKLKEFKQLLVNEVVELIPQASLDVSEASEPHPTFVENAIAKARHASASANLPALADDSGLCVNALNGAPGVHSARYSDSGTDADNNKKLLQELATCTDRSAFYHCVLVLCMSAHDPTPLIVTSNWHGTIANEPKGTNGFGYDPLFLLDNNKSAAQLEPSQKNQISHRAKAVIKLRDLLQ